MPSADQLMSEDMLAAEVAAARMAWKAGAQSGAAVPNFSGFQAQITNDGTNPAAIPATACARYDQELARAQANTPTSVQLAFSGSCSTCDYTMTGSWTGRQAGYSAYVSVDGAAFSNLGQVDSFTFNGGGKNQTHSFRVYFSNGATTGQTVTSPSRTTPNCTGCPS